MRSPSSISCTHPSVQHSEQDRLRRDVDQVVERLHRRLDPSLADGVGQRPDGARRRLGDERPDVVRGDRPAIDGVAQGQLVELVGGDAAQVPPIDVALRHAAAEPVGEFARCSRGEGEIPVARLALNP